MSTNVSAEVLERLLDRMPGVAWSIRMRPETGETTWVYINPKGAAIYGITEAEMMADPFNTLMHFVPEDRALLEPMMAKSVESATPWSWIGRLKHRNGEIRWLEIQTKVELDVDGSQLWYGAVLDVTERKHTEDALAASEAARARSDALHQAVIEALPVGVMVMETSGKFVINNSAAERINGRAATDDDNSDFTRAFGIFMTDGVTPFPNEELPLVRAIAGEVEPEAEMLVRNSSFKEDRWIHAKGQSLRDETGKIIAGMVAVQDVTQQRKLEREIRTRNEQLAASEAAKTALIERLRYSIDELSNPILEVWDDVLAMPIIGVVDSRRTADMVQRLLAEVARTQASFVIVDLTGVEIVDTKTADHLVKLIRKVELVGARCVLTGIRPAVAETLVDIGVDFGRITTLRNLKHGLRDALRYARSERDQPHDLDRDDEPAERPQKKPRARDR